MPFPIVLGLNDIDGCVSKDKKMKKSGTEPELFHFFAPGWIRTNEDVSQLVYSQSPLTAWVPTRNTKSLANPSHKTKPWAELSAFPHPVHVAAADNHADDYRIHYRNFKREDDGRHIE